MDSLLPHTFALAVSDGVFGSDRVEVAVELDGSIVQVVNQAATSNSSSSAARPGCNFVGGANAFTSSFQLPYVLDEGKHSVKVTATDAAGS